LGDLKELQPRLGIQFHHELLLKQAFVHPSYTNENPNFTVADNERMEFLGDALLNMIVTEILYRDFPDLTEGKLTEIRVSLIRQEKLAEKASMLHLGDYLLLGKGERLSSGNTKQNNLANVFEALLAAIFLDQGIDAVKSFIVQNFKDDLGDIKSGKLAPNFKALLQELTQTKYKQLPQYEVVESMGPDHDRMFFIAVSLGEVMLAIGSGRSKKIAESEAARLAYSKLTDTGTEDIPDL
jgi:ribonuclease III